MKSQNYWKEIAAFKAQLADAIPNEQLRALHVRRPSAHLRVAARQFAIVAVCGWALWHFSNRAMLNVSGALLPTIFAIVRSKLSRLRRSGVSLSALRLLKLSVSDSFGQSGKTVL